MNNILMMINGICVLGLMIASMFTGIKIGMKKITREEIRGIWYKHMTERTEEQIKELEIVNNMAWEEVREIKSQINKMVEEGHPIDNIKCVLNVM